MLCTCVGLVVVAANHENEPYERQASSMGDTDLSLKGSVSKLKVIGPARPTGVKLWVLILQVIVP